MLGAGLAIEALNAPPLVDQIADRIVESIANGRIAAGARLIEAELALALGVSRVPLRESLRVLQSQGLLAITPRRGTRVIDFDRQWARDLGQVRYGIERVSCDKAAEVLRRDPRARARLDAHIRAIATAYEARDFTAAHVADLAFHSYLVELAASPLVTTLWEAIRRHVVVLFSIEFEQLDRPERLVEDHLILREALMNADPRGIEAAVKEHVLWTGRRA